MVPRVILKDLQIRNRIESFEFFKSKKYQIPRVTNEIFRNMTCNIFFLIIRMMLIMIF